MEIRSGALQITSCMQSTELGCAKFVLKRNDQMVSRWVGNDPAHGVRDGQVHELPSHSAWAHGYPLVEWPRPRPCHLAPADSQMETIPEQSYRKYERSSASSTFS